MEKIDKTFPGVHALKEVDFDLKAGEVCGILGENGAGKSTLMNVLGGIYPCEKGRIWVDGKEVQIKTPKIAEELGISFIHQELSLFKEMDIATNIYIQQLPKKGPFLDKSKLFKDAKEILKRVGLENRRPEQCVGELKIGEQQLVEIGRTLAQNTKILILDEPTSSLTNSEIEILFKIVRSLKEQGVSIIFITHRMDEIFEICDSVMVMRDGTRILKTDITKISRNDIITNMLGKSMDEQYEHQEHNQGELLLSVKKLTKKNKLNQVSFDVHRGKLIGLYGLLGSGRTEVLRSIFGLDKFDSGEIIYKGEKLDLKSPQDAIDHKIAMVTEDRHKEGLVLGRSVAFNLSLANLKEVKGKLFVARKKEAEIADHRIGEMRIKTPSINREVQFLSGGNQQKVVIAKWLQIKPDLLLLDEPTRGVDIGAKREIYNIIDSLLAEGMGVIMVSSELPEIIGLCDEVVVLKEGSVSAIFTTPEEINSVHLLKAAMGG